MAGLFSCQRVIYIHNYVHSRNAVNVFVVVETVNNKEAAHEAQSRKSAEMINKSGEMNNHVLKHFMNKQMNRRRAQVIFFCSPQNPLLFDCGRFSCFYTFLTPVAFQFLHLFHSFDCPSYKEKQKN